MPTILEHKTVLDACGITFIPKGSSQSQETDKVDDILDDVSSLNNVTFEEESKELLDNLNCELKIDKCIKELDYGSLACRMKVVDNYPPLISSLLELISLHCDNLEGKTALVICHPGIKDEISAEPGSQEYNSKYIGLGIFLTLTKKNATCRLMFENKNIDIKKEIDQTIKQMTDMNNSPCIIVNTSYDPSISYINKNKH